jgi:transcription elongation factor GreA
MPHYVTEEGLKALQDELNDINLVQLPSVVSSIEAALKDGDIKENSPLTASREKQSELLTRLSQIETVITDYQIITETKDNSIVRIGSTVTVNFSVNNLTSTYRIVGGSEANPSGGLISDESPLGASLLGKKLNANVDYKTPSGTISVKILKIE